MTAPFAAALGLAGVEQRQFASRFGKWEVAVGGMKVADGVGRADERLRADAPRDVAEGLARILGQFDPRLLEERHGEIGRKLVPAVGMPHRHGKRFHDKLLVCVAQKRGCAEKQTGRDIHRSLLASIPPHAETRPQKGLGRGFRNAEREAADGGRFRSHQ